jgi:hypothetical protein
VNYVRGFAPWLCYAVLSASDWRLGLSAAAIAALVLLALQLRAGHLDLLGAATAGFFTVLAVIAIADPSSVLHNWITALANGVLAATALTSLAVRRPFTIAIARAQVPREFWHSARFIRVNMVLTGIWASAFTAAAIASALVIGYAHAATVPLVVIQILAFVIPVVGSGRYAQRARARADQVVAEAA